MEGNTYRILKPIEIVEDLCQGSANGFAQSVLEAQEEKLGVQLPAVLRDFLLRAGRERVCGKEKEIFSPELFQVKDGYLVLGKMCGRSLAGILLDDLSKDNPPVYVRDAQGNWDLFAESMEDCLLAELDRRIRKTRTANYSLGYLGSYYYCEYLLCKEWTPCMDASEVLDSFHEKRETVLSYWEGDEEESDWDEEDLEDDEEESDWDEED
ncbi:MAG: SMI1/KNR4 family protein [Lachnospiraceae bacterium]|nr:SMI1/KNR4 family protein [Lachnospiraceae bacterium]